VELRQVIESTIGVREALGTILHHEQSLADYFPARMRGYRERLRAGLQTVVEELAGERDRCLRSDLATFTPLPVHVDRVARPDCVQDPSWRRHRVPSSFLGTGRQVAGRMFGIVRQVDPPRFRERLSRLGIHPELERGPLP